MLTPPPILALLEAYDEQASELLARHRQADERAIAFFHHHHPRFLDPEVTWKPRDVAEGEIAPGGAHARGRPPQAVARGLSFRDWVSALAELVGQLQDPASPVRAYELAVEAVIHGDLPTLDRMLATDPSLSSTRGRPGHRPRSAVHGATLLHYLAANGVENYRQLSPGNAVAIARRLFEAGADPNALAALYGGRCATLPLLVSSTHPAKAGVQVPLVHALIDAGAEIDRVGEGAWTSPVLTALVFGFVDAARALAERGARVESVMVAAGLGDRAETARLLPTASADERHAALAVAAQLGNEEVVALLLAAGEDPNRFNPDGFHSHATPLHHAALCGHLGVVRLLVNRGARLDLEDTLWHGTPLGWAEHGGQTAVAEYLRAAQ
ncbi:MAG: ankyrin repeat domain-containing protein [Gemmatimonadales bacterium]